MGASLRAVLRSGILVLVGLAFGATFVLLGVAGVALRAQCPGGDWTLGGCAAEVDALTTSAIAPAAAIPAAQPEPARALSGREKALRAADGWITETFELLAALDEEAVPDQGPAARFEPAAEVPAPDAVPPPQAPAVIARRSIRTVEIDSSGQPVWPPPRAAAVAAAAEAATPGPIVPEVETTPVAAYVPVPQVMPVSLRPVAANAEPAAEGGDSRTVLGQGANVRSGPSSRNGVLFALPGGEAVTVGGEERGWLQVTDARGRSGWIYARYLSDG